MYSGSYLFKQLVALRENVGLTWLMTTRKHKNIYAETLCFFNLLFLHESGKRRQMDWIAVHECKALNYLIINFYKHGAIASRIYLETKNNVVRWY